LFEKETLCLQGFWRIGLSAGGCVKENESAAAENQGLSFGGQKCSSDKFT
jgi:hypothetical protein